MLSPSLFDGKCQVRSAAPCLKGNSTYVRDGTVTPRPRAIERLPRFGLESSFANE